MAGSKLGKANLPTAEKPLGTIRSSDAGAAKVPGSTSPVRELMRRSVRNVVYLTKRSLSLNVVLEKGKCP
jgi:hypothetical protein